ncbi:alpha/beta fold hydrolase [Saccharothrix sp. ST-888]|uniref:alpha/beta fold hydrolase n=1 Tax=Saccharothrix sp. ST-888 TaxID=1427391 RepID=UPI0005EC3F47|nr:hypothetical protein [Saccharothrix sp. ST-888]KJK57077.1 hypothetical protein UK12_18815 [Saccharothrix sp. ST-888]
MTASNHIRTPADRQLPASERSHPQVLSHLDALEAESVHIFREVAGEFERPAIADARLLVLPDAGHVSMEEHPARIARAFRDLITTRATSGAR